MAYTFDQINGLMGSPAQQKADIFSQQQPQQQGGMEGGGSQQGGSSGASQASGTTSQQGAPSTQAQASTPKPVTGMGQGPSQGDVLSKNQIDTQPGFTSELKGNISKAQGDLQNEANTYSSTQAQKGAETLPNYKIDEALGGDQNNYSAVQNYLYNNKKNADAFQSGVNTNFGNLDQLNNKAGLQQYLTQRGPETYNRGLASLDAQILSTDPNYQQGLKEARSQRDALQQLQQNYQGGSLQSQAQNAIDTGLASGQQNAKDYLNQRLQGVQGQMAQEAAAENNARAELRAHPDQAYIDSQVQKAYQELSQNSPDLAPYLQKTGIQSLNVPLGSAPASNPWAQQYFQVGGGINPQQAATSGDVYTFNRLQGLLNGGQQMQVQGGGNRESIDYNGLKQKMIELAQKDKDFAGRMQQAQDFTTGAQQNAAQSLFG